MGTGCLLEAGRIGNRGLADAGRLLGTGRLLATRHLLGTQCLLEKGHLLLLFSKWFEPRSISSFSAVIVGDSD